MFELQKHADVSRLIEMTKSNSGISGPKLAQAHIELGKLLGTNIYLPPNDTTVVAILRSGLFFAEGIYFQLNCKFQLFNPKTDVFIRPDTKNVILVDSVINTGETIKKIIQPDMIIACNVINRSAINLFSNELYTVRISDNSYVGNNQKSQIGNKGPDTTLRLFNQI